MSMKATDDVVSSSATLFATVDLPDPDPPAIPMMSGLSIRKQSYDDGVWGASAFFMKNHNAERSRQAYEKKGILIRAGCSLARFM